MSQVKTIRTINAPVETVFPCVAHIEEFSKIVPDIQKIEFLSENKIGVGAKFKETRSMNGRESAVVLEVLEYAENDRVRLVSDAGGTVWDTLFTISAQNGSTELQLVMDVKPYRMISRVMNWMIMGMVTKAIEKDMDAVKEHCEKSGVSS